ncbi:MAG: TrkH family potassium uptake protein [Clostridiales bacterium]|nr:TrkH family potassium uptake protein [Clostridiales bacterium]MDY3746775.1 TrkH family potassium uptake protein [Lachnospiraceae bacterium]
MNYKFIKCIIGWILIFEACFMVLPLAVALIYREKEGVWFVVSMAICAAIGGLCILKKPERKSIFAKDSLVAVALSWIVLSLFGALPFVFSGSIPSYIDALFEMISGFTTTGASILSDVESLPRCMLFWRSFSHWIGGMGVLVFVMAILPLAGGNNMYLMKAESPGPSVSKLVPKVRQTAMILYGIYIFLTLLQIVLLLIGRMPVFDAICTAFGTAGTGGFGIKNTSLSGYSSYIQIVTTVFMIAFGINFNVYFLILMKKYSQAFRSSEVKVYLSVILVSILLIVWDTRVMFGSLADGFKHVSFQVASIITTTGFSTVDFNMWPEFSKTVLLALLMMGACAGSTGGGIKVSRIIILVKYVLREFQTLVHPRSVKKVSVDGRMVEHEVVRSTNVFLIVYVLLFAISLLIVSLNEYDFTTNFTAVATTIGNVGPGFSNVGPASNFSFFSPLSKCVLMFDMLAGRLELFPMLIMLLPSTWKK